MQSFTDDEIKIINDALVEFADDLGKVIAPIIETMQRIADEMEQGEAPKKSLPDRINDPRVRRKKGRTTWR